MPYRVLVADLVAVDEKQQLAPIPLVRAIRCNFERGGWQVVTVTDGHEALRRVRELLPDVVVLNVIAPHPDGLAILRGMKAQPATSQIPVVMLSEPFAEVRSYPPHYSSPGEGTQYFQRPDVAPEVAPDYLFIKPFAVMSLFLVIKRMMDARSVYTGCRSPGWGAA